MKLATYLKNNQVGLGVALGNELYNLPEVVARYTSTLDTSFPATLTGLLETGSEAFALAQQAFERLAADEIGRRELAFSIQDTELLAPVPRPSKVVCLSGNYREHLAEWTTPYEKDALPLLFSKPPTTVIGHEGTIRLPGLADTVVWEVELAVVIGSEAREVSTDSAYDCIAGYCVGNDVSARSLKLPSGRVPDGSDEFFDWLTGKWFDTFAPLGPFLVTKDEIPDPHCLPLELRLNGEIRQQANTSDMIFSVPEIVSFASGFMTLEPGDVILTGTPAGLGFPDRMLEDGDVIEAEIGGLGLLRNHARRST